MKRQRGVEVITDCVYLVSIIIMSLIVGLESSNVLDFWKNILLRLELNDKGKGIIGLFFSFLTIGFIIMVCVEVISRLCEYIILKIYNILKINEVIDTLIVSVFLIVKFIVRLYAIMLIVIFIVVGLGLEEPREIINKFENTKTYKIAKNILEQVSFNELTSYVVQVKEVYNGVAIEKAMESSDEIKYKANEIIKNCETDIDKVFKIYNWIGNNIEYDRDLAYNIDSVTLNDIYGAKYAFETKSGVCFDFSTLFAAMMNDIGLNVRVIVGQGYNGERFGPHAWNEVYLDDEKRWINVDTTFWGHDDSFDNDTFYETHIFEKIAWEN